MSKYNFLTILGFFLLLGAYSCQKDTTFSGTAPNFSISMDTLTFDTVFTTVGSATRLLKVYNHEPEDIQISVKLNSGNISKFRLNVDGIPGDEVVDVLIPASDSAYIFADVTVDPDDPLSISPFIIEEYLTVSSLGSNKEVLLVAYGQNAIYVPESKETGSLNLLSCDFGVEIWDDPKPYVVYGVLFIDSCELILPPGTDIYVHGGLVRADSIFYNEGFFIVLENGKITSNGSIDDPVTFQGDRLEQSFDETPGQWVGVRISSGSKGNSMLHTNIKNSIVGVRVDSAAQLSLNSCEIYNTASTGIIGIHADIDAQNTLVHNTGSQSAALTYGGNYNFDYCTFASYGNQSSAIRFDNFRCSDPPLCQENVYVNPLNATFTNCIFTGNEKDEVIPFDWTDGQEADVFNYVLKNCAVTIDEILDDNQVPDFLDHCENCYVIPPTDTLFLDLNENDYHLDTMSAVIDLGISIPNIFIDKDENDRDATPDIGCYEIIK